MRGDWKYLVDALKFTKFYGANSCCHLCRAHKQHARYMFTNFHRDSVLRRTLITHDEFMRDAGPSRSELLLIPGFHIWRAWVDAAHNLDLGSYQYSAASGIAELTAENTWPAGTVKETVGACILGPQIAVHSPQARASAAFRPKEDM